MGQRINIQYSVDIDDLDNEVNRLVKEVHTRYSSLKDICSNGANATLSSEMLENIDHFRLELSAIDHQLNDVTNIISGYLHYKAQESLARQAPQQSAPATAADNLEAKLEDFKLVTDAGENEVSNQGN